MAGFAVLVIIAVLIAFWRYDRARKRRAAMVETAARREWAYTDEDPSLVGILPGKPFHQGDNRRVTQVVRGRYDDRDLLAFEHSYETTSNSTNNGTVTTTTEHSVVALSIGTALPALTIAPDGALSRLHDKLTGAELEIGEEVFDRAFQIEVADPAYARDLLVPEVRTALLRFPDRTWRIEGDWIWVIRSGHADADEIEPVLHAQQSVLATIPDIVWARVRGDR
jgi:hypothetical protein